MFYSWTDIEKLGYESVEKFAQDQMRHPDYEGAVVTGEGIEIRRRQHLSYFNSIPSVRKKMAQCKIFSNIDMKQTEKNFNNFCQENEIQDRDIIRVSYDNGSIFLVYNKELTNED